MKQHLDYELMEGKIERVEGELDRVESRERERWRMDGDMVNTVLIPPPAGCSQPTLSFASV